jgi:hypothetical protein
LYDKNESSIREVVKNKEKILASFSVAQVIAVAPDKLLIKMDKVLNFWVEDMNSKRLLLFITLLL